MTTSVDLTETETIYFAKVRENATIPSKRDEDGCYDVYACFDEEMMVIRPHESRMIPTGIASSCSPSYRFNCARERGSTGVIGAQVLSGQIDSGFRGEWFILLHNTSNVLLAITKEVEKTVVTEDYILYPYTKGICQMAIEQVPKVNINVIPYDQLKSIPSERGEGQIGSSGK